MRTLKTLLTIALMASIAYKANAYYRYRKAAETPPPHVRTVEARAGALRITLAGTGTLEPLQAKVVGVREVQSTIVNIVGDGEMVRAGQVVCQLDTASIVKDLRDRQAAYDTALAAVTKTEADVRLDLNNAETKTKKARQDQHLLLATNRATTDEADAEVKYDRSDQDQSEKIFARTEGLARDRLVPEQQAQSAELDVQSHKLNTLTASKKLEVQQQTEKIGEAQGQMLIEDAQFSEEASRSKARQQVENAKFNAVQTKRQLEMSQLQLKWCTITAPISGLAVVEREYDRSQDNFRPLRAGDQVYPSRRLMDLIDTSQMIVQADVGEIDIGHVRTGQAARVFPRAAPGLSLRARVTSVSEVAQAPFAGWRSNNLPGKKVFRVVLAVLDSRPKLLRPGMTADFELLENTVSGGVLLPIEAVSSGQVSGSSALQVLKPSKSEPPPARHERLARKSPARTSEHPSAGLVYVRKDNRFWRRTVVLGPRNDNDVLVTKGLKAGDVVAVETPPSALIGPAVSPERRSPVPGLMSLLSWRVGR